MDSPTALDAYALGYCIANFPIGVPWNVENYNGGHHSFTCGLNTKSTSVGVINKLDLFQCHLNLTDWKSNPLNGITALRLCQCELTNPDMALLSELIPDLPCLEELDISFNDIAADLDEQQDGLLKLLGQLENSRVTSLNISGTGVAKYSHDHFTALKHSSSETLKQLVLDDFGVSGDKCANLLSGLPSLKSLEMWTSDLMPYVSHLKSNTQLTRLKLISLSLKYEIEGLIDIVNHNITLEELLLNVFITGVSKGRPGWDNPKDDINEVMGEVTRHFARIVL